MLIDTHCHLDFPEFDPDRDEVIKRANQAGVGLIINVGSSLEGSRASVELAKKYDCVYAAIGVHPHEADNPGNEIIKTIKELAFDKKVVAIGEIGLDYFKNFSRQENQRPLFISLIELAKELKLPLILHSREAQEDTLRIMKEHMPIPAVVHCFSGDENFLNSCLDLGFYISFTCNITYKKAENQRGLVKAAPLNRIMLETDCPYLSAEGNRGRRNEPQAVKGLAEQIAKLKNISVEEAVEITTANAKKFFSIE